MTTRQAIVANALEDNGLYNGVGYPGPSNKFDIWLGRPNEYSCADGVTYWYAVMGLPLPLMQSFMQGKQTGASFCPAIVNYAREHGAVILSSAAQPADLFLFDWNGDGKADHVEMVVSGPGSGTARTIGADSGPSNVDAHQGQGGVHLHDWTVPNPQILIAVDTSKLPGITFGSPPQPAPTQHGHGIPPATITDPVWWNKPTDGAQPGWRDVHKLPAGALSVEAPNGHLLAYWDGHGFTDTHEIPTNARGVHAFHVKPGVGWVPN